MVGNKDWTYKRYKRYKGIWEIWVRGTYSITNKQKNRNIYFFLNPLCHYRITKRIRLKNQKIETTLPKSSLSVQNTHPTD